jgi:hypothetical protein
MRSLAAAFLLLAAVASAQPMMMDPSKMSGIPRPDPQVPAGTITVRLIRGQLSNRMVGVEVTLAGPDGKTRAEKTDAEGRATFAGLDGQGPYVASAKDGDTEQKSQPIPLEPQMGSRVMLVFSQAGLGAPDGVGHLDKSLPAGTLVVRAEDAAGQALSGLEVLVAHATKGEQKVEELRGKTDDAGEATWKGLDTSPTSGYLATVVANGARYGGKPFRLETTAGMRVVLQVRPVSSDTSSLSFAEGSHLLVEITDDTLQVIEVLRLHNEGTAAVDVGPEGLRIPLPEDALQIQVADQTPNLTAAGKEVVWKGPIPPGDTQLRVGFSLLHHGGLGQLTQSTPIPFARLAMVTQRLEGLSVEGHGLQGEEREMQGRKLMVFFGEGTPRGGALNISFTGLPAADPTGRYAAAAVAVALVVIFGLYAAGGGGAVRARLERERRKLFDELRVIDAEIAKGEDRAAAREQRVERLAEIYRGLDELGGG